MPSKSTTLVFDSVIFDSTLVVCHGLLSLFVVGTAFLGLTLRELWGRRQTMERVQQKSKAWFTSPLFKFVSARVFLGKVNSEVNMSPKSVRASTETVAL